MALARAIGFRNCPEGQRQGRIKSEPGAMHNIHEPHSWPQVSPLIKWDTPWRWEGASDAQTRIANGLEPIRARARRL